MEKLLLKMSKDYLYKQRKLYNSMIIIIGIIIPLLSYRGNYNYFERLIIIFNNKWFIVTNLLVVSLNVFRGMLFYDNISFKQRTKGITDSKIRISKCVLLTSLKTCVFVIGMSLFLTFFFMNLVISGNTQIILLFLKQSLIYILLCLFSTILLIFSLDNFGKFGFIIINILLLILLINYINLDVGILQILYIIFFIIIFYVLFLFINRKKA